MRVNAERIANRLQQLTDYICNANEHTYWHCLKEFCHYCENTPALYYALTELPQFDYDWNTQWHMIDWPPGPGGCAFRWSALTQLANVGDRNEAWNLLARIDSNRPGAQSTFAQEVIAPLSEYLVDCLGASTRMLHLLVRYKRWAEWFKAKHLRQLYQDGRNGGEQALDASLRCFLFESGIDYPLSQPASPGGRADVVAGLDTDDPLVLEVKVWDSSKRYKEDRVRDGLRQVMDYAKKYGKDTGFVIVFNLDQEPLSFINQTNKRLWPPHIERGGGTYFFLDIHIPKKPKPISQRDKGKPVRVIEIDLGNLLNGV